MNETDVLIIGGGASGLAAAVAAARLGERATVLEKLDRPGKKLLASGNGRCNLLNRNALRYYGDSEFAYRVMGSDPVHQLEQFWEMLGLRIRWDAEGRGYPCTFQASTVLDVLKAEMIRRGVVLRCGERAAELIPQSRGFLVRSDTGHCYAGKRLILACGGMTQPKLGGGNDAWEWLRALGHTMIPAFPALTPLITDARSISGLAGIRARCSVSVETEGKEIHREKGEILFTDRGISGICAMQCARFSNPGKSLLRLDLTDGLFLNDHNLTEDLMRLRMICADEPPTALLKGFCVPKLAFAVCKQSGLSLRGETCNSLTEKQVHAIVKALRSYTLAVLGRSGYDSAQVTAGGANCEEFDPVRMASRICPGLHVTGELLNVDGDCGGYNLMFAFMSGLRAGLNGRDAIC